MVFILQLSQWCTAQQTWNLLYPFEERINLFFWRKCIALLEGSKSCPSCTSRPNVVEKTNVEQWWNDSDGGESEPAERNPPVSHFATTSKVPRNKSWRLIWWMECWASIFILTFSTTRNARVVSCTLRPHVSPPPKEVPCYSFRLDTEWTLWLLNAGWRKRSLENFQGLYRESNLEPLFFVAQCLSQLGTSRPAIANTICNCWGPNPDFHGDISAVNQFHVTAEFLTVNSHCMVIVLACIAGLLRDSSS